MGCDSQFDPPYTRADQLADENAALRARIAKFETAEAERLRDARGYDESQGFFVCRFDRTVTDSMDAHDRICTRPKP